jgi:monoamine oxidase
MDERSIRKVTVAVVGAGLSGLTAAFRLFQAGIGVVVLEGRDRVGGRAWRLDVGGLPFDAGCEALDHAHVALLTLAAELGISTWETEPWAHDGGEPSLLVQKLEEEVAALVAHVDPDRPEETEGAGGLDGETLADRLAALGASPAELGEAEMRYAVASSTVPIREMSLLAYAAKLAAGAAPTGLTLRLEGGPRSLAERLAAALGGRLRLGVRVTALADDNSGVTLQLADGGRVTAARAIVAVPLTLQRDLRFDPPLPRHRRLALERARYGEAVKVGWAFDEVAHVSLPEVGPGGVLYQPDPRYPLLALFAGAGAARKGASRAVRRSRASRLVDWRREPFTRGTYLVFGPGELTTWGRRLAESHGRVHFAGAEASNLPSYIEGAVRAGERAARDVLAAG